MRVTVLKHVSVVIALCTTLAVWGVTPAGAAPAPVWGAPITLALPGGGSGELKSVSCTSALDCVGVGVYDDSAGDALGVIAVEANGAWSSPVTVGAAALADAKTTSGAVSINPASVACYSSTQCTAVGSYEDKNSYTESFELPISLSGTAATPGTAVTITGLPDTDDPDLGSVACSSSGACTATGADDDTTTTPIVATSDGGWKNDREIPKTDLPSNYKSVVANESFVPSALIISCPATGVCAAVAEYQDTAGDDDSFVLPMTDGTPGTATELPAPAGAATAPTVQAVGISCPSAGVCTATGEFATASSVNPDGAFSLPITSGTPGTPIVLSSTDNEATGLDIACFDASDCDLAGAVADTSAPGMVAPVTDTEVAGTWAELTPLTSFSGSVVAVPLGLSCTTASTCGLIGLEVTSGGKATAFIVLLAPALSITTSSLPAATAGTPYSATLQSTGGQGATTWAVSTGSLPAGLSLNPATGVISGTPTAAGVDGFVVQASNSGPAQMVTAGESITVSAAPTPVTSPPVSTPTPTPAPARAVAAVRIAKLFSTGNKVSVTLACAKATCKGGLVLSAVEHLLRSKVTAVTASTSLRTKPKTKTRTVVLAKGTYSLAPGSTKTFTLVLSRTAAKLLSARHGFSAKLALTPAGSKKATVTKTVALKAAAVKKAKPKK